MADMPNQLQVHVLHAASRVSYLLPSILVLVLVILLTVLSVVVVVRLTSQSTEVNHANAALQCQIDACEVSLHDSVEASDCDHVEDAKTSLVAGDRSSQSTSSTPAVVSDSESEKVHALEARLSFLRDSCRIMFAQKNDLLAQRDDLLAQQNVDIAMLKAQLAASHQMKNDLLAEKDASFKAILGQKNEEAASIIAQLLAAQQSAATVVTERDGAVAHAGTIANELEKTRVDYDDKVASLTRQVTYAESTSATLQTMVQQQTTEINTLSAELTKIHDLYNSDLERFRIQENNNARTISQQSMEIAMLMQRLEAATRQRPTPASPRYSFQSIMYRRTSESESESDSSFDSEKPSPSRWRRFTLRLPRRSGKF